MIRERLIRRRKSGGSLTVINTMTDENLFQPWFDGDSWASWRTILKACYALPMDDEELRFFKSVAGDRDPPTRPVKELWCVVGRRGGKDSIASLIAAHVAAFFDKGRLRHKLRPGERPLVMCLACDREQAGIVLGYTRSYFDDIPMLHHLVDNRTTTGFALTNDVDVSIVTNNFRKTRGRSVLCVILDEVAYWRDDNTANPDVEVYNSIRPGMATIGDSLLVGISSPYRRSGLLWSKYRKHYGKDGDDVLVIQAASLVMNPTVDQAVIDKAMEEDPAVAQAEWYAQFRSDLETFVSREVIDACVIPGRHELEPVPGVQYSAFCDPSGGSADSMTLAIGHLDRVSKHAVIDAVRERRPPFSPDDVVSEFVALMKTYRVHRVVGDRYAGEWPVERFRVHGARYDPSKSDKNEIYAKALSDLNSHRIELLDHAKLVAQFCSLERHLHAGAKPRIDHPKGSHDDIANAVAGVACLVLDGKGLSKEGVDRALAAVRREAADPRRRHMNRFSPMKAFFGGKHG